MHVRKRKSGKYQGVVRVNNAYITKTFIDRKSCMAWGRKQEQLLYSGILYQIPKKLTLQVLIENYLKDVVPNLKDKGLKNQLLRLINKYGWLVQKHLQNLTPSDFYKFKFERVQDCGNINSKQKNYRAVNKDLNILSVIINRAIKIDLYPLINHIKVIERFPESKGLYRPIKGREHRILLKHANIIQKAIILIARHTGARPNEIHNLRWNNLDIDTNEFYIPWNINKSNRSRVVPIRPYLTKWLLKNLNPKTTFIIPMSQTAFRFWLFRKVNKLGFDNFVLYHYRRQFVQYHANKKVPMPQLAIWTGHTSLSLIARYYGLYAINN